MRSTSFVLTSTDSADSAHWCSLQTFIWRGLPPNDSSQYLSFTRLLPDVEISSHTNIMDISPPSQLWLHSVHPASTHLLKRKNEYQTSVETGLLAMNLINKRRESYEEIHWKVTINKNNLVNFYPDTDSPINRRLQKKCISLKLNLH